MTTLYLHVRDYDGREFYFDGLPQRLPVLTTKFVDGYEHITTGNNRVGSLDGPVRVVVPPGRGVDHGAQKIGDQLMAAASGPQTGYL